MENHTKQQPTDLIKNDKAFERYESKLLKNFTKICIHTICFTYLEIEAYYHFNSAYKTLHDSLVHPRALVKF